MSYLPISNCIDLKRDWNSNTAYPQHDDRFEDKANSKDKQAVTEQERQRLPSHDENTKYQREQKAENGLKQKKEKKFYFRNVQQ